MKKIILAVAILTVCAVSQAADAPPEAFRSIYSLTSAGVIPGTPVETGLTRAEAAKLIASGVKNVTEKGFEAATEDINALYKLVKMFTTDLVESGIELGDVEEMLVSLRMISEKERMRKIFDKQEELEKSKGLRIKGEASVSMVDLYLSGGKYPDPRAYRPMTEYLDLSFYVYQSSNLSAEAVFRLESIFGSYWSAMNIYGVRKISIYGNYPVSFELGAFNAGLTPYTLYAVDDSRPFEAGFFTDKRDAIKRELYLEGSSWPLTGLKLHSDFKFFGEMNFSFTAMAARVASANDTSATSLTTYINAPSYTAAGASFTLPHDRYLAGGRLSTDFSMKDALSFGINFVDITDIKESGLLKISPSMNNLVSSADAYFKPAEGIKLKGEFAFSNYYVTLTQSAQDWMNKDNMDIAFTARVEAEIAGLKIDASYVSNGKLFTSYAAQSRVYDGYDNAPYISENNTWNIANQPPSYMLESSVFPLTRYSPSINGSYNRPGRNQMPYVFYENNAMPYGGATPNRQGAVVKISGDYLESALKPMLNVSYLFETESFHPGSEAAYPKAFLTAEAGAKFKSGDLSAGAGYKFEMTENSSIGGGVNLVSSVIDASLAYDFGSKLTLKSGFRGTIFSGSEAPYTYLSGSGWVYGDVTDYDASIMRWGIGAHYSIFKYAVVRLSFAQTFVTDNLDSNQNYTAQEIDFGAVMKF